MKTIQEIKEMKKEKGHFAWPDHIANEIINDLIKRLEVARAALKCCANEDNWTNGFSLKDIARDALEAIK